LILAFKQRARSSDEDRFGPGWFYKINALGGRQAIFKIAFVG
jgi:hypothetical protein